MHILFNRQEQPREGDCFKAEHRYRQWCNNTHRFLWYVSYVQAYRYSKHTVTPLRFQFANTRSLHDGGLRRAHAPGFPEMHTWVLNRSGPISQNYHAIVQSTSIYDENNAGSGDGGGGGGSGHGGAGSNRGTAQQRQLSVLTRRTMAVASLDDGQLEYMLARRLTDASDNQGQ